MEYATLWAYLWDLLDEGIDRALTRMRDEAGVRSVSLATAYHTAQHLRPHAVGKKFFAAPEAALYFQPDRPRYRDTPLQPRVSPLVIGSNPLREVSERCQALGMGLISWTVTLHNSHLGSRYPEAAVHNVFGDCIQEALCPAQEPVRAYVRALVDDLTANYHLAAVELEALGYPVTRHYHGHEKIGIALGPLEQFLIALCFCPACQKALADRVDCDAAARAVHATLQGVFATGEPTGESIPDYLRAQPAVAAYLEARKHIVTSLVQEIRDVCRAELIYMDPGEHLAGADPAAIAASADRLETLCYDRNPQRTSLAVQRLASAAGGAHRVSVGFACFPPASPDAATLAANVRAARECGVGGLSFYHYGIMPAPNLRWVRQALAGGG